MYLDFDDHHPDTPHLPPAFSRLERVLLTVVAYLVIVIAYLVMPASWFQPAELAQLTPAPKDDVTFVMMEPLKDRVAPPKVTAEASDIDRQASTRERPPLPKKARSAAPSGVTNKGRSRASSTHTSRCSQSNSSAKASNESQRTGRVSKH